MEHNEWKPTHGSGGIGCLTPKKYIYPIPPDPRALVKTSPSMMGAIFMIPRPKLGGDSIYTLCHGSTLGQGILPTKEEKTPRHGHLSPHLALSIL